MVFKVLMVFKILKLFIGFIFAAALGLVVLELFLQKAEIETVSTTDFDSHIGRIKRPNMNFIHFNEGFSMGQYNNNSILGPDCSIEKKTGVFRIAILGDSYVESLQVFRRDQFISIIEKQLSKNLGKSVEVLNFGRSGFDLADMFAYQQNFVNQFKPDLILYFLSSNDLICKQTDLLIPKVILKDCELIVTNDLFPQKYLRTYNKTKWLTQNSITMQMLVSAGKLILAGKFWPKMLGKFHVNFKEPLISNNITTQLPPLTFAIQDNFSSNTIVVNRGNSQLSKEFMIGLEKNKIPFVSLRDTLTVLKQKGIDPYYWVVTNTKGHLNHMGHKAIGYYLSEKLSKLLIN